MKYTITYKYLRKTEVKSFANDELAIVWGEQQQDIATICAPSSLRGALVYDAKRPTSGWANWALIASAFNSDHVYHQEAMELCRDRLNLLTCDGAKIGFVVLTRDSWGVGMDLIVAAKKCNTAGGKKTEKAFVYIVLNDDKPEVNATGAIVADPATHIIRIGGVRTLGSLIRKA